MGNNVFRYFLEWLKHEMHDEAYKRLVKAIEKRDKPYRGRIKEEPTAFVGPNRAGSQSSLNSNEPIVQFNVKDQMYTIANSVVNSIDELWHTYFPGQDSGNYVKSDSILDDYSEWHQLNNGERHPKLWELAQAEGDEKWLDWIHDHVWTYIGLSAPLLGAINPVRAVIRYVESINCFPHK